VERSTEREVTVEACRRRPSAVRGRALLPQFGTVRDSHTVSTVRKVEFLDIPVMPGFSGYMKHVANT